MSLVPAIGGFLLTLIAIGVYFAVVFNAVNRHRK